MSDEYIEKEDAIQSIIAHDLVGGDARGWAEYLLENTSTADVAPVVRCKDCKHWDEHSQYGYDYENGVYGNYCMLWTPEDDFYAVETPADGFCFEAKRRDDE